MKKCQNFYIKLCSLLFNIIENFVADNVKIKSRCIDNINKFVADE